MFRLLPFIAAIAVGSAAPTLRAQDAAQPPAQKAESTDPPVERTPESDPENPGLWNAERMMEDAVLTISRRYNLNPEQEKYTRVLLTKKTRAFLNEYEKDLRQLIKESIDLRIGRMPATPDGYKSWSDRARPIFDAAKKAILEGNAEWRGVLNEEQQRLHDQDLAAMEINFKQISQLMDKWSAGEFQVADLSPQPPQQAPGGDARMSRVDAPQTAHRVSENPPLVVQKQEDIWEMFVRRMIELYRFTDDQKNAAFAILRESRTRARGYRDARKADFEKRETAVRDLSRTAPGSAKLIEAARALAELEKPLDEIFAELRTRVDQVPTQAQRAAVSPEERRRLDLLIDARAASAGINTPTTVGPTAPTEKTTTRRASQPEPKERDRDAPPAPSAPPAKKP